MASENSEHQREGEGGGRGQGVGHTGSVTWDFSVATLQAKRQWNNALKVLREYYFQTRILYSAQTIKLIV